MSKRVAIIGAAGYTAGELLRLLVHHPDVKITYLHSESQAGRPVHAIHTDLLGETDLVFAGGDAGAALEEADAVFLCTGHGRARAWVDAHPLGPDTAIIDLSTDYRMDADWVYGLPEFFREEARGARRIANPGCFATAIQLGLLPLVTAGLADGEVHINGMTGSTGAGQRPLPTTNFSWRNANVSVYKAFGHQHLNEIGRTGGAA